MLYELVWAPSNSLITIVEADSEEAAIGKAPPPWNRYPQDIKAKPTS